MVTVGILTYDSGIAGFTSRGSITIDHTQCGTADSANFPVLVSFTNNKLKTLANGGQVTSASGFDICFSSNLLATPLLSWEVETWDGTTGTINAWVLLANVSHTVDTVFYIFVGNSSIVTYQGGAHGAAWPANYDAVWHLPNGTVLSLIDSTSNLNNGTNIGAAPAATGKIDGGVSWNGTTQAVTVSGAVTLGAVSLCVSAWVNFTAFTNTYNSVISSEDSGIGTGFALLVKSNGKLAMYLSNGFSSTNYDGTGSHTLTTGSWFLLTLSYDPTGAGSLIGYVNGAVDATVVGNNYAPNVTQTLYLGQGIEGSRTFAGFEDEARVGTVCSASTILTNFNNQNAPGTFMTIVL